MLTFFTTAKPFREHDAIIQRNALKSWKLLHPDVEVIFFGDDEGAAEGGPLFDDAYQILKARGVIYNGNLDQLLSHEDGRPLQANAIFCRV